MKCPHCLVDFNDEQTRWSVGCSAETLSSRGTTHRFSSWTLRRRDQRWRLIAVKSTADVKDHHLYDVAIQSSPFSTQCNIVTS